MNNKHFLSLIYTYNAARHLLKHEGLVCKIYVLSFNSPMHQNVGRNKMGGKCEEKSLHI